MAPSVTISPCGSVDDSGDSIEQRQAGSSHRDDQSLSQARNATLEHVAERPAGRDGLAEREEDPLPIQKHVERELASPGEGEAGRKGASIKADRIATRTGNRHRNMPRSSVSASPTGVSSCDTEIRTPCGNRAAPSTTGTAGPTPLHPEAALPWWDTLRHPRRRPGWKARRAAPARRPPRAAGARARDALDYVRRTRLP